MTMTNRRNITSRVVPATGRTGYWVIFKGKPITGRKGNPITFETRSEAEAFCSEKAARPYPPLSERNQPMFDAPMNAAVTAHRNAKVLANVGWTPLQLLVYAHSYIAADSCPENFTILPEGGDPVVDAMLEGIADALGDREAAHQ